MKEFLRCEAFLKANGYKFLGNDGDEWFTYVKDSCYCVDLSKDEIVLIDDTGDFFHHHLSYYALVGVLIEYRQIHAGYISVVSN